MTGVPLHGLLFLETESSLIPELAVSVSLGDSRVSGPQRTEVTDM